MKDKRKDLRTTIRTFVALLLVMLSLLSLVCYLNFDQNYREVKQSTCVDVRAGNHRYGNQHSIWKTNGSILWD